MSRIERNRPGRTIPPLDANLERIHIGAADADTAPGGHESKASRPVQRPERVPLGTYVPAEVKRTLKARCAELGVEMQDAVTEALTAWLAQHPTG